MNLHEANEPRAEWINDRLDVLEEVIEIARFGKPRLESL